MSKSRRNSRSTKRTGKSNISPIGPLTRTTDRNRFDQNTWVVYRNGSERKPMMFDGRFTRDEVRCAYSRETGTDHDRTRSRRLSNY